MKSVVFKARGAHMNSYSYFPLSLYTSLKFGLRNLHLIPLNIVSFLKICDGKAVLSSLACVKLKSYLYHQTA
jgi:hypothetical protein